MEHPPGSRAKPGAPAGYHTQTSPEQGAAVHGHAERERWVEGDGVGRLEERERETQSKVK